jgi:DNA-binding NtrC family response regulator
MTARVMAAAMAQITGLLSPRRHQVFLCILYDMKTIFLIEDDRTIGMLHEHLLNRAGLSVVNVETREAAAEAISAARPDLIFSDLQLTEGTPETTIHFLTPFSASIPVVICSGCFGTPDGEQLSADCQAAGFMDCMKKLDVREPSLLHQRLRESYDRFHATKTDSPKEL